MSTIDKGAGRLAELPVELVLRTLDHLPKADIWHVTQLSRRLRVMSLTHARCFIPIRLDISTKSTYSDKALIEANKALLHSIKHQIQVGLYVEFDAEVPNADGDSPRGIHSLYERVFDIVSHALSVAVRLTIHTHIIVHRPELVLQPLRFPAPLLRRFSLRGPNRSKSTPSDASVALDDLFQGMAPCLTCVELCNLQLNNASVSAFSSVRQASLVEVSGGSLVQLFPSIRVLELTHTRDEKCLINFRGISLHRLHVEEGIRVLLPLLKSQLNLADIPVISFGSYWNDGEDDADPIWAGLLGVNVDLRLAAQPSWMKFPWELFVASVHEVNPPHRCRASIQDQFLLTKPILKPLPFVVNIHMASWVLSNLIKSCIELPSLRRLRLDLDVTILEWNDVDSMWGALNALGLEPKEHDGQGFTRRAPFKLSCPRLEVLALYAIKVPAVINAFTFAHVGRACACDGRTRLEMFGVTFDPRYNVALAERVFPHIDIYDFDAAHEITEKFPPAVFSRLTTPRNL